MSFATRRKKQGNDQNNEISAQLISKTTPHNTSPHYDTFTDQSDATPAHTPHQSKTRRSHSRESSHHLSPSSGTDHIPRSSPVTPRKENKLAPKSKTPKKILKGKIFGFNSALSSTGSIPTMKYQTLSDHSPQKKRSSTVSRPQSAHIRAMTQEKIAKGLIKHKNIVPQLWDNEREWMTHESESYDAGEPQPPLLRLAKLPSSSTSDLKSLAFGGRFQRKPNQWLPMTPGPEISSSRSKSQRYKRISSNYTEFPDTERHQTSRAYNKQFILDRIQTRNTTASLFRRRSVVSNKTPVTDYRDRQAGETPIYTIASQVSFSMHEEPESETQYEMLKQDTVDYNQIPLKKTSYLSNKSNVLSSESTNASNRKQLVYIGGISDRNRLDVRDRLFDLFEMWGDRPDLNISETDESYAWKHNDCIYVRFPSIAQAVAGIKVFDGLQPNGYALTAKLVLEGSQMVYIDGLDADWNEEIFKAFVDANTDYKVSIKRNDGDKAYAFVQFASLEAVQSAIDRFDGETEIDGKLVRWEQMVKAYIGCIGEDTTDKDIQNELSEFDPSFRYLPVEIKKSREPIYYPQADAATTQSNVSRRSFMMNNGDDTQYINTYNNNNNNTSAAVPVHMIPEPSSSMPLSMPTIKSREPSMDRTDDHDHSNLIPTINIHYDDDQDILWRKQSADEQKSAVPMMIHTGDIRTYEEAEEESSSITDLTEDKFEYEWHHYAYVWFWNKYDALRAQSRFDQRICFGSGRLPVRFLLMNDMTQKVYVSGLMASCASKESIEWDIHQSFVSHTALWRKKCIVTYRENDKRPFAYLRFPSIEATKEAVKLFDNEICFGNQAWPNRKERKRIHLEIVRDVGDLLSHHVVRKWHAARYWWLTFAVLLLPFTLTYQWAVVEYKKSACCRRTRRDHIRTTAKYDMDMTSKNLSGAGNKAQSPLKLNHSHTAKELAFSDLLQALFCLNDEWRDCVAHNRYNTRCICVMISYALYFIFYGLILNVIAIYNNDDELTYDRDMIFSALLPIIMYCVIAQLFTCWCCMEFEVALPQFHVLEHVSMYFENYILYSIEHIMASEFVICKEWDHIIYPWQYPIEYNTHSGRKKLILLSLIYAMMYRLPWLYSFDVKINARTVWQLSIEIVAAVLMFGFCFILLCCFQTIVTRTLSYWRQVHGITELISYRGYQSLNGNNNYNFLSLNNEQNLFAWLTLRGFIHRKGDTVFCGLEMNALFLVICVFVNISTIVIVMFGIIEHMQSSEINSWTILMSSGRSGFVLAQIWFLCICLYYIAYALLIGYWFGKENQCQLKRVEKQKLYLYTERMKQLLNHEKYKLCDNTKITDLKILLNSMDALIQHVETNQITPQLWGIKMNDFKWKIAMTVIAAVIPSVLVRWMLNVN